MPVATVKAAWEAISLPWSQVTDRARCSGRRTTLSATAAATCSAVLLSTLMSMPGPRRALHQRGHRTGAPFPDDQVTLPVAGHGPVLDLGGAL